LIGPNTSRLDPWAGLRIADTFRVETQTPQALTAHTRDHARALLARAFDEAATMPGTLLRPDLLAELGETAGEILADVLRQDDRAFGFGGGSRPEDYNVEHSIDSTVVGLLVGRKLISQDALEDLATGLFLQDIGKLALPPGLVHKEGPLAPDERELMMQHPLLGLEFLRDDAIPAGAKAVVRSHHERWDGSGYPSGLVGEEISLFARIAAVADAFDAVTSERYHAPAVPGRRGVEIIRDGAGSAFDPLVVEAFIDAIRR
jgi:HD-GYP domain-containing protein (c-di-GMP phosphodiesterase class II)